MGTPLKNNHMESWELLGRNGEDGEGLHPERRGEEGGQRGEKEPRGKKDILVL